MRRRGFVEKFLYTIVSYIHINSSPKKCFCQFSLSLWNLIVSIGRKYTTDPVLYVCRIDFFSPKINKDFQLKQLYLAFSIYIGHIRLIFEAEDMASFLANQNFPFWSPSKSCIYEANSLETKEAQFFTTVY